MQNKERDVDLRLYGLDEIQREYGRGGASVTNLREGVTVYNYCVPGCTFVPATSKIVMYPNKALLVPAQELAVATPPLQAAGKWNKIQSAGQSQSRPRSTENQHRQSVNPNAFMRFFCTLPLLLFLSFPSIHPSSNLIMLGKKILTS